MTSEVCEECRCLGVRERENERGPERECGEICGDAHSHCHLSPL